VAAATYNAIWHHLSWWPLSIIGRRPRIPRAHPRRIAYYHHAFPILTETFIQREILALRRAGIDVVVLSHAPRDPAHYDDDARRLMETTHYLYPLDRATLRRYRLRFFLRRPLTYTNLFLYLLCRRHSARKSRWHDHEVLTNTVYLAGELHRLGVEHVHTPWAGRDALPAMLAAHLLRISYSVQARAFDLHKRTSAYDLHERLAHATFVITNTHYNEAVIRPLLRPAARLHVISNGVDLSRFYPVPGPRAAGPARLLCIARFVEQKGLEYLLAACTLLRDAGRAFECRIVGVRVPGSINYYIRVRKLWRQARLASHVTFLGAQVFDRVLQEYSTADIVVLPAVIAPDGRRDITPNVLIEAMAMQLPVVSTYSAAIPEIVEDGVTGLLVPPHDAPALAEAIARLCDDASLRQQLGRNGRARVEERFDITKNVIRYVELFRSL
jgi:glycosyltransferase involved in cell wall biosynthesis